MKIRAILETETMDPDFREPFLNGMPFDITESTFDRIVRYASGCTDVQQPDVIAMVIQHSLEILNQMDLLRGCDDQYFDYNVDEVDMVLYGATIIQEQEKYKPLIMQKFQHYKDNFDEEEHAEEIEYYLNFLEKPETLYTFTENTINFFKSLIK